MIGPLIVVALLGAPDADIRWADVPLEPVPADAPAVTRVFAVPHGRVEDLAQIASLFEERVRIVATGDRLVVFGPESLLDHIARVAEVTFGSTGEEWRGEPAEEKEPAPAEVETVSSPPLDAARAGTFRQAIAEAMSAVDVSYSSFASPASRRLATGREEVRQQLDLKPAPLSRLIEFAREVLAREDVRLASFDARTVQRARNEGERPYVATFEFVLLPEGSSATSPFLDFEAVYDELTRRVESSGVQVDIHSLALHLEGRRVAPPAGSSARVRYRPSSLLLTSPDARAHLALTDAFVADDSLFSASADARPQDGGYRVHLRLEPNEQAVER